MSQDNMQGASTTDLAPEASASAEAVPPYNGATTMASSGYNEMRSDVEFFTSKYGNDHMTEVSWGVSNSPDFSGVPADDFPKVSKVINAVDEWLDDMRHRGEGIPVPLAIRTYAAEEFQTLCTDEVVGDMSIAERREIMREAAGDLRDTLASDDSMHVVFAGIGYNHGTEVPDDQIGRVTGILVNLTRAVQNAGYLPSLYELQTMVTQEVERAARDSKSEAPASEETDTTLNLAERREIMRDAEIDLSGLISDRQMLYVLSAIGFDLCKRVPDEAVDKVTQAFVNIQRAVNEADHGIPNGDFLDIVGKEVARAGLDSKSEAPASDETATTLEGKIADTTTAEAIDEMSSEHAQHAIDREMEQAAHEKQMLRIQTMINIGVGVVMSSVGVTSIKITSEALQQFSRDYEVVTEPTEDGGYTIELLDRSSMAYSQYVAAQMEGIADSVGVPAANLNLVNPGEI